MTRFVCSDCGSVQMSWFGKCPECGAWNTLEKLEDAPKDKRKVSSKKVAFQSLASVNSFEQTKTSTYSHEVDRVLGEGIASNAVMLLAGEPGIGKSTLLLEIASHFKTIYVSGEESPQQIQARAKRMGVALESIQFSGECDIPSVLSSLESHLDTFSILVIDSIQTMYVPEIPSVYGSVSQIKEVTSALVEFAKRHNKAVIIIGHVTKSGDIAGPKTMEHLVDVVLQFEGDKNSHLRVLRASKNRFGTTSEVGLFEMTEKGLQEAKSSILFEQDINAKIGRALVGVAEGMRPLFYEVQCLVVPTSLPMPRRVIVGYDTSKAQLLLAVIRKQLHISFDAQDVYITVVGGMKLKSTAAELAICAAILSSQLDIPLSAQALFTGEVDLLGAVRPSYFLQSILKEAKRYGFTSTYSSKNVPTIKNLYGIVKKGSKSTG